MTALVVAGCSSDDDDDGGVAPAADDVVDPGLESSADDIADADDDGQAATDDVVTGLEGRWQGTCQTGDLPGTWIRRTNDVEGAEYTVFLRSYADEQCTQEALLVEISGTLTTDEPDTDDGTVGGEVDLIVDSLRATPLLAETAEQLNAIAFCDRADYALDVTTDIESCSMLNVESVPYTEYDRFLVEGDTLYVGPMLARTIEDRALEVDFTDPYTRLP